MPAEHTLAELLARPRENRLVLQFSTAAPDFSERVPKFCRKFPLSLAFDNNWGSGLIRRATHSPFSHVDMLMKDGNLLGASDNAIAPFVVGNPRGVAIRPPDYQRFAYRRQMVIATERADDIRRIASTQLGKGFDNGALKDFISDAFPGHRDWRLTDSWFCAELTMWAMETGFMWGTPPLPWPKNRVTPTDILMMFLCDERWTNRDEFWKPIPGLELGPGET